ncbi:MAG TPA: hypothetical protein VEL07_14670 [Planctomycetota bacterium]|nr:hypothetical protein [Planctomycetota bacterium]
MPDRSQRRRGAVTILVAGTAAILAALALAFIGRMRSDAEGIVVLEHEVQAKAMLIAGCSYILEAGRIGWDDPRTAAHEETFGWIDVRDGRLGPKHVDDGRDDDSRFPVGASRRFPMHAWERPPFAIAATAAPNPIRTTASDPGIGRSDPAYGLPLLVRPDPQPAADDWSGYASGDPRPLSSTTGMSWFRIHRESASRFVITCGAGATHGWRDWDEVVADGATATFGGDARAFDDALAHERRLWYRVEWSPAVTGNLGYMYMWYHAEMTGSELHLHRPVNSSQHYQDQATQMQVKNAAGTLAWVQRLVSAPSLW